MELTATLFASGYGFGSSFFGTVYEFSYLSVDVFILSGAVIMWQLDYILSLLVS